MKNKKTSYPWLHFGLASILVIVMGVSSSWQMPTGLLQAQDESDPILKVELSDNQPIRVSQKLDQKVAEFKISTNSTKPIEVNSLKFYALGSLKNKIVRNFSIAPLRARLGDTILGEGDAWIYDYGSIQQTVDLEHPLIVSFNNPVMVDMYVDLFYQHNVTFGISLFGIESSLLVEGVPLDSYIHKIQTF